MQNHQAQTTCASGPRAETHSILESGFLTAWANSLTGDIGRLGLVDHKRLQ
jgi:hypothetical protein